MNFFRRKISGIRKRRASLAYGIFYWRDAGFNIPAKLNINGAAKKVRFIDANAPEFIYEFNEICLFDCYHLKQLKKVLNKADEIVDIGANQGLFAIAARKNFPTSAITCYEPNHHLKTFLDHNAAQLNATVYYEAVAGRDCRLKLNFGSSDLHTRTVHTEEGEVTGTAFRKIIERAGGTIDILKMDCEGVEWELLADKESWMNIRSVAMEYHLWAREDSTVTELARIIEDLGFTIIHRADLDGQFGILIAVRKDL